MDPNATHQRKRRTKIVCTLGPVSATPAMIRNLLNEGMDVVRINCSHGDPATRLAWAQMVREIASDLGLYIPIIFDLQGPKIRVGRLEQAVELEQGQDLFIEVGPGPGSGNLITTSYSSFAQDVKPGQAVLLDDGKIRLKVVHIEGARVHTQVEIPGLLRERKGINLPETALSTPCLTEKDMEDLALAIEHEIDFVAISFVRSASDVETVRAAANKMGPNNLNYISKIERPEAVKDLIPIIEASDGVMVARGDLGVEIGSHRVPMIQKEIIMRANLANKFVITATQMLESMMTLPIPTRAEATDVANAILDGTDACMLSGETAMGSFPLKTVAMMAKIAHEAETHPIYRYKAPPFPKGSISYISDGISIAAYQTASLMGARLLVAFTNSGSSALKLSKRHPDTLIVGATIHPHIARRLRAYWGVIPVLIKEPASVEAMFDEVQLRLIEMELVRDGDVVILTSGFPLWTSGSTNLMKVMEIDIP